MIRSFILLLIVLVSSATLGSEMPAMVPVADFDGQIKPIKAALTEYRALTTWSGVFRLETNYTKAYYAWFRADTKQDKVPPGGVRLVTIKVEPGDTTVKLDYIDKGGGITQTTTSRDSDMSETMDQIKKLVFLTDASDNWAYYAGQDRYVRYRTYGHRTVQFDPSKNFVVSRIEWGDAGLTDLPVDFTTFSDYRLDAGRWTAWRMSETILVPGQSAVGWVTTVTVEKFGFLPKPIIPKK